MITHNDENKREKFWQDIQNTSPDNTKFVIIAYQVADASDTHSDCYRTTQVEGSHKIIGFHTSSRRSEKALRQAADKISELAHMGTGHDYYRVLVSEPKEFQIYQYVLELCKHFYTEAEAKAYQKYLLDSNDNNSYDITIEHTSMLNKEDHYYRLKDNPDYCSDSWIIEFIELDRCAGIHYNFTDLT